VETRSPMSGIPVRGILVMLAIMLTAGCGVSKSKYLDATKRGDDLAAKNTQLQASLDQVNKEKADLEAQNAALDSKVKEMESHVEQTQSSTDEAKATYEAMIQKLQGEVSSGQVEIKQLKDIVSVNLAQDILFPPGSAKLDKQGKELLGKVAEELKTSPFRVVVNGHTDDQKIGAALAKQYPSNWELGGARASQIVRLFQDSGIAKDRLAAVSFADSRPREDNATPEGRTKNRRIEIKLVPPQSEQVVGN